MNSSIFIRIFYSLLAFMLIIFCLSLSQAEEEERTYSISLTKTAETQEGKEVHEVDDKKVLAQEYTIQKGDHVWQLLRERGLLEKRNLAELLAMLKKMNTSLHNLDLIHPGEKIIIPLKIGPRAGMGAGEQKITQSADLKDIDFQRYTVKKDDYVIRVVRGMYRIPEDNLYGEYLDLVRQLNPSINDIDKVYPGQTLRLPIYSPQVVRAPIKDVASQKPGESVKDAALSREPNPVAYDLAAIFSEIGEEWVQSGEHFIPLKSGGQINLKALSFPIINMKKGHRVIVDLDSKLPEKIVKLIESSWDNYRIVCLTREDTLRSSLDKILRACDYPKATNKGEALEVGNEIALTIKGDWIIKPPETELNSKFTSIVINLRDNHAAYTPRTIKDYAEGLGVKIFDYPPAGKDIPGETAKAATLNAGGDPASLIKAVLNLAGKSFSTDEEIRVYETEKDDLKLLIRADFVLKIKERDALIDLTGLAPEVISLLEEQQYLTLSLASEKDPLILTVRTFEFLDFPFQQGPLSFKAIPGDDSRNIRLTLPGIIFSDSNGESILATPLDIPDEINAFLAQRGYKTLFVSLS